MCTASAVNNKLKYFVVVLLTVLLTAGTAAARKTANGKAAVKAPDKDVFTVVIDPGHGGRDAGCVGKISREKDINLAVAKALQKLITDNCTDVKVVMTRSTDRFIPLQRRADIANDAKGDLFISIHVNSVATKSPGRDKVSGASVYTVGTSKEQSTLNVAMRENAVIELEDDYSQKYSGFDPQQAESYIIFELTNDMHRRQSLKFAQAACRELTTTAQRDDKGVRQDGFWVLWAAAMPAVLVELDFICNPACEKFLASADGQQKCAQALFNAFRDYRDHNAKAKAAATKAK